MLTTFAFLVLVLLAVAGVYVFIKLAFWPRNTARECNHPQADAINALSWSGLLLTGGIGWIIALTWAYMRPAGGAAGDGQGLLERLAALEAEVTTLKSVDA